MAINYLSSVDFNQNELIKARIENQPNDTSVGTGVEGQLYYDTTLDVLKVFSNGSWVEVGGGVTTLTTTDSTFIDLTPNTATSGAVTVTAALSATGTPDNTKYLRGDNTWSPISGISGTTYDLDSIQVGSDVAITLVGSDATIDTVTLVAGTNITLTDNGSNSITIDSSNLDQTITLTGEVTGSGTSSIATTVSDNVLDVANFNASAIITAAEGIENNNNDTTLPTSAAVKAYVDTSVVGGLVYQGGYDAATNTPNLDATPIVGIKKGWTYTVTVDGLFFTEQVRVGDVLIAEIDSPTTLAEWTTVQNNIDIASASQIGIGNVAAGSGVNVSYSNGTATVSVPAAAVISGSIAVPTSGTYTYPSNITAGQGFFNVLIQLVDSNGETVYADVQRLSTTTFSVNYGVTEPTGVIALVQKIG